MHEATMLTERSRAHDASRIEMLFVLLVGSIGLSSSTKLEFTRTSRNPISKPKRMHIARNGSKSCL